MSNSTKQLLILNSIQLTTTRITSMLGSKKKKSVEMETANALYTDSHIRLSLTLLNISNNKYQLIFFR